MNIYSKLPKVTLLVLTLLLLVTVGCRKSDSSGSEVTPFVVEMKQWFENEIVSQEQKIKETPLSELPKNDRKRVFARMPKLSKLLQWRKAEMHSVNGLEFIVVPIDQPLQPFHNKNYTAGRCFIFFKNVAGEKNLQVVEVISNKQGKLNGSVIEIAALAFKNSYLKLNNNIGIENAFVAFYDKEYKMLNSYEAKNGTWVQSKTKIFNKQGSTSKRRILATTNQKITCQVCTTWYTVGIWYDQNTGQVVDWAILDQWDECTETEAGSYGDPDPGVDEECVNSCIATANQLGGGQVSDELEAFEISDTGDPIVKNKNPKWYPLKNVSWSLKSIEYGKVKLIDVQRDIWQWESLTHGPISKVGITPGGTVTYTQGVGTPSFVAGTPNILYAGMSLEFEVTYAPVCNCPGISELLPPWTDEYTATAIWDAKPIN